MEQLTKWIDKNIEELGDNEIYTQFFSGKVVFTIDQDKYLSNPEKGLDIVMFDSMKIHTIHLFSGNTADAKQFTGEMVQQINFKMSREAVKKILGNPNRRGGGFKTIWGNVPLWDKYYFDTYSYICNIPILVNVLT